MVLSHARDGAGGSVATYLTSYARSHEATPAKRSDEELINKLSAALKKLFIFALV